MVRMAHMRMAHSGALWGPRELGRFATVRSERLTRQLHRSGELGESANDGPGRCGLPAVALREEQACIPTIEQPFANGA